jgi:hypothetical protein
MWFMSSVPAPADPGRDDDPARGDRDPVRPADREAWLDRLCAQDDDPFDDPQEYWDPDSCAPPPGEDELTAGELAEVGAAAADEMLALDAASTGRRGPGQTGSARVFPGESASRAARFGAGMAWDGMPGCAQLAVAADAAVDGGGPGDAFGGVADHELVGLVCAWDRVEAHAAARKLVAIAEVFRRNPEDGFEPEPACDQRIRWWAGELRQAGLEGGLDELRARAFLDLVLGKDSRPRAPQATDTTDRPSGAAPSHGAGPASGAAGGFIGQVTLTVPLGTAAGLADRPGELGGHGPVDPWLARDLAAAAARNPKTTWCVTVTDEHGHAVGHGCARPEPKSRRARAGPGPPDGTGFSFTPAGRDGLPGGYGTWRLRTPGPGPGLIVTLDPLTTDPCEHRHQARGHDPGARLRHLSQVRHATCTSPICRRPATHCDFEHNIPYEAGGRSCLCNGGPKCRHDHRLKQHPKWTVAQLPDGTFRWTTPTGRSYDTEPTRYPI